MIEDFAPASGVICESLRIAPGFVDDERRQEPRVLSLSLMKLDPAHLMAVLVDVTLEIQREQETLARRLERADRTDQLTQLPNRLALSKWLRPTAAHLANNKQQGFAVLFLNCDRFKQINDAFGYALGDKVITTIAERIRAALRQGGGSGQLVARFGGDEFVIVLDDIGPAGEACSVAQRLLEALGKPYDIDAQEISCNVSIGLIKPGNAAQTADEMLLDASFAMAAAKRDCGMHPAQLQLEVTESLAAQDQQVQLRLHELKGLGITLALDDFGTGYSSLSSLHLLPVDTIKVDRSFVSQADTSHHHRVLIEATISVARSLGMGTVAEGIETESQSRVVRQIGCDKGQGYLFSRPLASDELAQWITAPTEAG